MSMAPEIRTTRLLLRPYRAGDEAALVRNIDHAEIARGTATIPHPYTRADAEAYLARVAADAASWHLAITLADEPIGGIGLMRRSGVERYTAEVGYWLTPRHWRRGIASEAAQALVERAFAATDVVRLEARVFAWNSASCHVLERTGFRLEARRRSAAVADGRLVDELLYARLRGE
jgi:RimJ/RimL family protein N-acetyltransferase